MYIGEEEKGIVGNKGERIRISYRRNKERGEKKIERNKGRVGVGLSILDYM